MKIIKPEAQIIQKKGLTPYQFIEKVGRTCYKSEDKITEDSAVKFVQGLCNRNHYAMVEHYWVHLKYTGSYEDLVKGIDMFARVTCALFGDSYDLMKFVQVTRTYDTYISAPLRVFFDMITAMGACDLNTDPIHHLVDEMLSCVVNTFPEIFQSKAFTYRITRHFTIMEEDDFCDDLHLSMVEDCCEAFRTQELMKHKTHTVHFVCDRGVSHELVRHRPCSFAQESTRYCNYSHSKFGEEITVIKPLFFEQWDKNLDNKCETMSYGLWARSCEQAEKAYFNLLKEGATPQEARSVLPNSLKTEIIVTANETEWQHIVNLRYHGTTGAPHPQMKEVMSLIVGDLNVESGGRIK